jgi:hypothetical protein
MMPMPMPMMMIHDDIGLAQKIRLLQEVSLIAVSLRLVARCLARSLLLSLSLLLLLSMSSPSFSCR